MQQLSIADENSIQLFIYGDVVTQAFLDSLKEQFSTTLVPLPVKKLPQLDDDQNSAIVMLGLLDYDYNQS